MKIKLIFNLIKVLQSIKINNIPFPDDDDEDNLLADEAEEDGEEEEDDDEDDDDEEDDEDSDEDDEDNPLAPRKIPFNTPKVEAKEDLVSKFLEINGKRLYVRFPNKLPESVEELTKELKSHCALVQTVIKPRQKYARHCMVEFLNNADREKALKVLSAVKVDGKDLVVKHPTMEDKGQIEGALEKQSQKKQEKRKKSKLRKMAKKQAALVTSTLFITNIPPTATVADLKEHFPNAIDIKVKHNKDSQETAKASVTLQTPEDATKARKLKIAIDDKELHIKFDIRSTTGWRSKQNKKFKMSLKSGENAPQAGQKRSFKGKSIKKEKSEPAEKKIKVEADPVAKVNKKKYKKPKSNKKAVGVSA